MHKNAVVLSVSRCSDECAELLPNHQVHRVIGEPYAPQRGTPLNMYTHESVEGNAHCFQDLKCILQGTEVKVYVDKFNITLSSTLSGRS